MLGKDRGVLVPLVLPVGLVAVGGVAAHAVAPPAHRAVQLGRGIGDETVLGIEIDLVAEAAADHLAR